MATVLPNKLPFQIITTGRAGGYDSAAEPQIKKYDKNTTPKIDQVFRKQLLGVDLLASKLILAASLSPPY